MRTPDTELEQKRGGIGPPPWRWEDHGQVLTWEDGTTVAFKQELISALESAVPSGCPPFAGVALVFAACKGKIPLQLGSMRQGRISDPPHARTSGEPAALAATRDAFAINQLSRIPKLPKELISDPRIKSALLHTLFEGRMRPLPDGISQLRHQFNAWIQSGETLEPAWARRSWSWIRCAHQAALVLSQFDDAALILRLRTGLNQIPDPAQVGIPSSVQARHLMEELEGDERTRPLARLAKDLMAAVHAPRKLGDQGVLSTGGVSGLTHRGPLDRLLVSELASDDLLLMSRVALGEALYLRREPPSQLASGGLAILLDQGLRLWGWPRVFVLAAALAWIARDTLHPRVTVWRAAGHGVLPANLLSREGVITCLENLESDAHPGEALGPFAAIKQSHALSETILLTHHDALSDPGFRRSWQKWGRHFDFVGTVDRWGHFRLYSIPFTIARPLCESTLNLADSLRSSSRQTQATEERNDPAFLGEKQNPLLLPVDSPVLKWHRASKERIFAVLQDRRLMEFHSVDRGAIQRVGRLPSGSTVWMDSDESSVWILRAGTSTKPARLVSLENSEPIKTSEFPVGSPNHFAQRQGRILLVICESEVIAFQIGTGAVLDRVKTTHRWHRGRYLAGANGFLCTGWDGTKIRLEPVPMPSSWDSSRVIALFDREGHEGAWAINQNFQVGPLASNDRIAIPLPIGQATYWRDVQVSVDGHRIYTVIPELNWHSILDLQSGRNTALPGPIADLALLDDPPRCPHRSLHKHIVSVRAGANHSLELLTREGSWLRLEPGENHPFELHRCVCNSDDIKAELSFQPIAHSKERGCQLQRVQWPRGTRAILDSRGLLHLADPRGHVPELTLALCEGEVAAWSSDQSVCGPDFFLHPGSVIQSAQLRAQWIEIVGQL